MKKNKKFMLIILVVVAAAMLITSCKQSSQNNAGSGGEWLIPENEVRDGGPGRDGIPALTDPPFVQVQAVNFLLPNDLVVGIIIGNVIKAAPHRILDRHEILNDLTGAITYVLSYCPLTGSAMAWHTLPNAGDPTFGVSGLLYNSNLILYDRDTGSNWAQMRLQCVNGPLIRQTPQPIHVIETTWQTWQQLFPNSLVLSDQTGFTGAYDIYPYGDYKTSSNLLFPANNQDDRLHPKERVHGVIVSDATKVYPIRNFPSSFQVINEAVNGVDIVVVGSYDKLLAVSFERTLPDGTVLTFSQVQDELPVVLVDDEGTKWDVFGRGISGPRTGSQLTPTTSFNAYWFAWTAFYPGADIWL